MVILFFSLVAVETTRLFINLHVYINHRLERIEPTDPRAMGTICAIGMLFDVASLVISGIIIVLTFGSIASILVLAGTFGTIKSLIAKRQLAQKLLHHG